MTPMERNEIVKALGRLKVLTVLTVARGAGETDLTLQLAAYAAKLADWPADVVREVLATQPRISKWWPAWAELEERLRELAAPRRALQAALASPTRTPYRRQIRRGLWIDGECSWLEEKARREATG